MELNVKFKFSNVVKEIYKFLTLSVGFKKLIKLPGHYLKKSPRNFTYYLAQSSSIFDATWYQANYDLEGCSDAIVHFATIGRLKDCKPCAKFDPEIYAKSNHLKDTSKSFIHFCLWGKYFGKYQNFEKQEYSYLYEIKHTINRTVLEDYFIEGNLRFGCIDLKKQSTEANISIKKLSKNKKVLLINHDYSLTGGPLYLSGLASVLIELGFNVEIWTYPRRLIDVDIFENVDCNIKVLPKVLIDNKVKNSIKSFDLVFCNTIETYKFANLCRKNSIKHFWLIHEPVMQLKDYFKLLNCKDLFVAEGKDNHIVTVSELSQNEMNSNFGFSPKILRNFIDINTPAEPKVIKFQDNSVNHENSDDITFGFIGTLFKHKGIDTCLKAFFDLPQDISNRIKLEVYGGCHEDFKINFKELYQKSLNCNYVTIHDLVSGENKDKAFSNIDVFIIPSLYETCSRVALEAASIGKTIIMTEYVGAKYILKYGGGEVIPADNVEALKQSIIKFANMPKQKLHEMGALAYKGFKETSSRESFKEQLLSLIEFN